jgi:hypothetical protein
MPPLLTESGVWIVQMATPLSPIFGEDSTTSRNGRRNNGAGQMGEWVREEEKWAEWEKRAKDYANVSFTNMCSDSRRTMAAPTCSLAVMS